MKKRTFYTVAVIALFVFNSNSLLAQNKATIHQDKRIATLVQTKNTLDKNTKKSKYKIQLANGSKAHINAVLSRFYAEFPNTPTHKVYESPEYKVRVGQYRTKLEAERALILIRKEFPNAIIVKL